uniref:Transmembrane protein n=1 Tax=Caenorhabditis japonica TaxID=281687 RepID=A0A8R1DTI9_CAEJA
TMLSTTISHHLFSQLDAHRIIEEMDRNELEMRILEHTEHETGSTWPKIAAFGVGCAGITLASSRMVGCDSKIVMGGILAGGITIISSTMALGWWWWRRKVQTIHQLIWQMERTKAALRRKKQIYFSISMRLPPSRNPLICRACRSTVSAMECLVEETQRLNATSTWIDLYTDEMAAITSRSVENPEKLA